MDVTGNNTAGLEDVTDSYELLQELGDYYTSVGNYSKAEQCYGKAASAEPDEPEPYIGLGVVAFKVACRLGPNCSVAYTGLAMVAEQQKDLKTAFEMYLKSMEQDADNLTALLGLFQTSCQMGSFEQVREYLKIFLDMHPQDTSVMFSLAALYMKDDRLEQSMNILRSLLELEPDNKDAANLLEEVERSLGRPRHREAHAR